MSGNTIKVSAAYEHPLFYKEVDSQTGYRTKTILAVPIKNVREEVIGVCEAINKIGRGSLQPRTQTCLKPSPHMSPMPSKPGSRLTPSKKSREQ